LLQAPALAFVVPKQYQDVPLLTGRAVVEMQIEKADDSAAFLDAENGGTTQRGSVRIAIDGACTRLCTLGSHLCARTHSHCITLTPCRLLGARDGRQLR